MNNYVYIYIEFKEAYSLTSYLLSAVYCYLMYCFWFSKFQPGLSTTCPCSPGLTCAVTGNDHGKKKRIFQCISIGTYQFEQENEERPKVLLKKIENAKP